MSAAERKALPAGRKAPPREAESGVDEDVPTELCLGSDGRIYVSVEHAPPEMLAGRKMFHGFAMTAEEAGLAVEEFHRMAFNVTVAVQDRLRERKRKAARKLKGRGKLRSRA
jgi:hypothetical protein